MKVLAERSKHDNNPVGEILNAFNGFIYTVSRDFRIEFLNQALIDRIGYDATGEHCYQVINGLEERCPWCVSEVVLSGKTTSFENKSPKDNKWYYYVSSPHYDSQGIVTAQQLIAIDIDERRSKEDNLEKKKASLEQENTLLKSAAINRYGLDQIIGQTPEMQDIYNMIFDVASSDASVLIYGESGTGKELVASAIHNLGKRKNKAFVPVNCGGIPENLIESEFFGYKKGAFTGANIDKAGFLQIADKGTLFLDEIGEINLNMQVKLLRALDGDGFNPLGCTNHIRPDIRVIAATNRDLGVLVDKKLIRSDFYYRINVIPIHLPPLRKRKADISLLIYHFLRRFQTGKTMAHIPPKIMTALEEYEWPGNIRELQNIIHRYVTLDRLDVFDTFLPKDDICYPIPDMVCTPSKGDLGLNGMVAEYEKNLIVKSLENHRWHKGRTAAGLGINRKTLYSKMKKFNIRNF